MIIIGIKPLMNAPSRASGGRIHVCPCGAYVSMHGGGHVADERRSVELMGHILQK